MGKEFIDYDSSNGRIPYNASTICFCLTQYARNYIKEKRELTKDIDTKLIDAILVDAINYMGRVGWCDFALCTKDLHTNRYEEDYVDPQALITVLKNHLANYLFKEDIVKSIHINRHLNEVKKAFDPNDGAKIIIDFINYITKVNNYDRTFTIKELHNIYKEQKHNSELEELKRFLEKTGDYTIRILYGESVNDILKEILNEYNCYYYPKTKKYYREDPYNIGKLTEVDNWDTEEINEKLYALTYAYVKGNFKDKMKNSILDDKIKEMKKR